MKDGNGEGKFTTAIFSFPQLQSWNLFYQPMEEIMVNRPGWLVMYQGVYLPIAKLDTAVIIHWIDSQTQP